MLFQFHRNFTYHLQAKLKYKIKSRTWIAYFPHLNSKQQSILFKVIWQLNDIVKRFTIQFTEHVFKRNLESWYFQIIIQVL